VSFALGFHSINTLEVVLLTSNLFNVGRADLTQVGAELIAKVAEELKTSSLGAQIEVEGHTDSDPLKKSSPFKTNWNLSTARASAIAEMLVKAGIEGSRIRATGYSHFQPLAPEFDDRGFPLTNNKALNRRIVIKLHFPDVAKADSESETNPKPKNINNTDKG
jgi:chemotaxis protein MotB